MQSIPVGIAVQGAATGLPVAAPFFSRRVCTISGWSRSIVLPTFAASHSVMHPTQPHSPPSSYALEKAVRIAARRLGSAATEAEIEEAAVRLLVEDGFSPATAASATSSGTASSVARLDNQSELHLSVSAAPCVSRRLNTQRARLYDRLRTVLAKTPSVGASAVYLHVRDTSSLTLGHPAESLLVIAETLVDVLNDLPVSHIHAPFIDAALAENTLLLERVPELISQSARLCPTIQLANSENGLNESALEAICLALAIAAQNGKGSHPLILSTQDCDRRAFGHRVHPEAIVAFLRQPPGATSATTSLESLSTDWHRVGSADLPLLRHHTPHRTTDHVVQLSADATPESLLTLIADELLAGPAGGARRQLMILC